MIIYSPSINLREYSIFKGTDPFTPAVRDILSVPGMSDFLADEAIRFYSESSDIEKGRVLAEIPFAIGTTLAGVGLVNGASTTVDLGGFIGKIGSQLQRIADAARGVNGRVVPDSGISPILGLERPFRTVDPARIERSVLQRFQSSEFIKNADDFCIDCSELADDLLRNSSQGSLIRITPANGNQVVIPETINGKIVGTEFDNHFIFTDGKAVFDPRLSLDPVPQGDFSRLIRHLNPDGVVFERELFKSSVGLQLKHTKF